MKYFCCDERRRAYVRDHGVVNGVDYNGMDFVEVLDAEAPSPSLRQRRLFVHFIKPLQPNALTTNNALISGGERIRGIAVVAVSIGSGADANILTVDVDQPGDFSTYTLRIVQDVGHAQPGGSGGDPPAGFDPVLSSVAFSFKVECPSDFDCFAPHVCPPDETTEPEIDYLAKDYTSFRQLMLDRISVTLPKWSERNAADLGVALVELFAYAADHLSYRQDVIATEAYLETARRRVSVRRHALLVDYPMHDGCNARVWIQAQTDSDNVRLAARTPLVTRIAGLSANVINPQADAAAMRMLNAAEHETFETMFDATLFAAHNEIELYTWHEERCCLPAGATSATLKGSFPNLRAGDVLVFEEIVSPLTGDPADANPANRHAVRLTSVASSRDLLFLDPPGSSNPQLVTEIVWHTDDALPFALCISARTDASEYVPKVSVARGNIVLADHGQTIPRESLGVVPAGDPALAPVGAGACNQCTPPDPVTVAPRFNPRLAEQPLTQAAALPATFGVPVSTDLARDTDASASAAFRWEMRDVLPAIAMADTTGGSWHPRRDLLSSDAFKEEFVAEVDDAGDATLRFGDDQYGRRPTTGSRLTATYRVGNGVRGNVGAESIAHMLTAENRITSVRNPMPASGGVEAETIEHVRRSAPSAFRIQERAVTADDYASVAERHREVQRAAATFRWTGSWRTVFLTVDRLGGRPVDEAFQEDMRRHLERFRMAGQDVEIDGPQFVPIELELTVCVQPGYFRSDLKGALLETFSAATRPDGTRGIFHPDNLTFGQPVYLSAIYAAAQKLEGVRFATVDTFQRLGLPSRVALDTGVMTIGRLEIAQLDNDPNFAERGVIRLTLEGGR